MLIAKYYTLPLPLVLIVAIAAVVAVVLFANVKRKK
jgi:hypothetical protein